MVNKILIIFGVFVCLGILGAIRFRSDKRLNAGFAALILASFAAMGLIVAIFSEPGSIQGGIPFIPRALNENIGRFVFGGGALISFWMFTIALKQALGKDKE